MELILVTGGAASGKSAFAQELALQRHADAQRGGRLLYLATMHVSRQDEEGEWRVRRHRALREGMAFVTIERERELAQPSFVRSLQLSGQEVVLLEDLPNLLANELYRGDWYGEMLQVQPFPQEAFERQLCERILEPLLALAASCGTLVVVTGEIFSDGLLYEEETRRYVRALGMLHAALAARAAEAWEVVCGIPLRIEESAETWEQESGAQCRGDE